MPPASPPPEAEMPHPRPGFLALSQSRQQGLAAALLVFSALTLVRSPFATGPPRYEVGKIQPTTVIADFDFPILKDPRELERERAAKTAQVAAIVVRSDSASVATRGRGRALREKVTALRRPRGRDTAKAELELAFDQETLIALLVGPKSGEILDEAERLSADVMQRGYVSPEVAAELSAYTNVRVRDALGEAIIPAEQLLTADRVRDLARQRATQNGLPPEVTAAVTLNLATPNLLVDRAGTEAALDSALSEVDPSTGMVLRGEKIIGAHERITPEKLRVLKSMEEWRGARGLSRGFLRRLLTTAGNLLLILVLLSAFVAYLWYHRRSLLETPEDLWLLAGIESMVLLLASILIHVFELPPMLVPVAAVSILATLFFDDRLGMAATVLPVFLVGLVAEGGTPFFAVVGLGSLGAVLLTPRVRQRRQFYWLLALVPGLHLLVLAALGLAEGSPPEILLRNGLAAAASPFLATAVALFVLPILESLFHRSTDLALLELLDLNRPLLRRLMLLAPGTYHHSVLVGALAESAAQSVEANPLLARAIGYYHDIGKLAKPEYFPENVAIGRKNPHDRLAPSMSRLIQESHLREGVALAHELRLPREVVQGIREHHGQSVMTAWYLKAKSKDESVRPEEFRYPGPRPTSKESALVLLANEVEGAARSLEEPSPSRVKGVVHRVVQEHLDNGNLDDSGLTLTELAKVREAFTNLLSGAFHGRAALSARRSAADGGKTGPDPGALARRRT